MLCFFFCKQKTAYEIESGLVGSEMCIRDSAEGLAPGPDENPVDGPADVESAVEQSAVEQSAVEQSAGVEGTQRE